MLRDWLHGWRLGYFLPHRQESNVSFLIFKSINLWRIFFIWFQIFIELGRRCIWGTKNGITTGSTNFYRVTKPFCRAISSYYVVTLFLYYISLNHSLIWHRTVDVYVKLLLIKIYDWHFNLLDQLLRMMKYFKMRQPGAFKAITHFALQINNLFTTLNVMKTEWVTLA